MSALLAILVCIGLIVIDQVSKFLAIVKLAPIENITVIPGILDFTFVKNYGAAFGILQGQRWFFVIITIVILGGILVAFWKLPKQREFDYGFTC
ncbi:MAG: signal peptidase II [Clostridiales bacterium]|nr:signal peptidase II [Clostridiales bacterium]